MAQARHSPQTISWFWDLYQRGLLDLDPPYQRKSVWNSVYKAYFIDTLLLEYPAPAIFLFSEVDPSGKTKHSVVDGKQRLVTIFDFVQDRFPVGERAELTALRGKYFRELADEVKVKFWSYQFSVEYLPTSDENAINSIFDRINRNVAKLTPQELRHARFDGAFISTAEKLTEWLSLVSSDFPRITPSSRNQMKDVEFVANLLLLLEEGPKGYSVIELDTAFTDRDEAWEGQEIYEERFRKVTYEIVKIIDHPDGNPIKSSRLRNQSDFYSLFGAIDDLQRENKMPSTPAAIQRLLAFLEVVDDEDRRTTSTQAKKYYEAARSASNLGFNRKHRIETMTAVLLGNFKSVDTQ
ncbi:DUF262 domain-containing protein [Aquisphaera insulae]|uniref:DUF262 domain-containing protein n=1 Tax=Aquisphaera insulae TaxID=2712864 RepID=UPI0013EC8F1D|nr:DUF262 domain-containing protein [Aquisphaera insulae]